MLALNGEVVTPRIHHARELARSYTAEGGSNTGLCLLSPTKRRVFRRAALLCFQGAIVHPLLETVLQHAI